MKVSLLCRRHQLTSESLSTHNSDPNLLNLSERTSAALATTLLNEQPRQRFEPTLGGVRETSDFGPDTNAGPRKPTSLLSLRDKAKGFVTHTSTKFQTLPRNVRISVEQHREQPGIRGELVRDFEARATSRSEGRERRGGLLGIFRRK